MAYEPTEEGFAYWGNEGSDQTQLILTLSEQIAGLQAQIEEQGVIIDELAENVVYKDGATSPTAKGGGGIRKITRMPFMRPEAVVKTGVRMGARATLKELGVSVPFIGLIISLAFMAYEGIMKEIADKAVKDAIREHEIKDAEERREIYAEALQTVEKERRETYRSFVP